MGGLSPWRIQAIQKEHDRAAFDSGRPELDDFLRRFARQNEEKGLSRTYVATSAEDSRVLGYFSIRSGAVASEQIPEEERRRLPRYPVPVVHLARLAVDRGFRGRGLGEALLMEALRRSVEVSRSLGVFAVEVVAKDDEARRFYEKYGFRSLRDDPCHLYLSIRTIWKALR